jgi:hypothetical protein
LKSSRLLLHSHRWQSQQQHWGMMLEGSREERHLQGVGRTCSGVKAAQRLVRFRGAQPLRTVLAAAYTSLSLRCSQHNCGS